MLSSKALTLYGSKYLRMEELKIKYEGENSVESCLEKLAEHGVLVIEDFLGQNDLNVLIQEYENILKLENDVISAIDYPQGVARRIEFSKLDANSFPKTHEVFNMEFMKKVTNRYLGTPNHFNHEIYVARDEHEEINALNKLHYDKLSTLKFFLYLNDIDKSNGAFEAVPGSHKLAQSIMEFFLSGSMAKVLTLLTVVGILMLRPQGLFALKIRK